MSERRSAPRRLARRRAASMLVVLVPLLAASPPVRAQEPEPLTVERAVALAIARAPGLAAAVAAEDEAKATARASEDAFRPEAWVATVPGWGEGLPASIAGRLPAAASAEARYPLYDPGRRADVFEARARRSLARAGAAAARVDTVRAVVLAFDRCWTGEALLAGAERRLAVATRQRARAEALRGEGRATDLDVAEAALREARARQARLERESDRDLDQLELRHLVGLAPNVPLLLAGPALASVPGPGPADDLALARAADHESAGLALAAEDLARAERLRGKAALPVVELAAEYARLVHTPGYDDFYKTFKPDSWSVGLSVVVPVLTGGRTGDARARAQAALERVEAQRRDREAKLEMDVRRAEADLARGLARASLARRAEAVAEEGLRVTQALADEGRADLAALDQRELALADAADERLRADAALLQARVASLALRGELHSALGGVRAEPAVTENRTED